MNERPTSVRRDEVLRFLNAVGAPIDYTVSVEVRPQVVEVTVVRLDEQGKPYAVGDEFAVEAWQLGW